MFTAAGFERTWEYIDLIKEGLICTVSLSLLTVIFGFVLALLLAIMRLSNVRPFRFLGLTPSASSPRFTWKSSVPPLC